jgi:predicted ATP-dependent serine protease
MVRALERRVSAAVALGFRKVVVPRGAATLLPMALAKHMMECGNVAHLKRILLAKGSGGTPTDGR